MKEEITNLRVKIDGLAQLTKNLKPIEASTLRDTMFNSREINMAHDSLILAKAWLGKVLQELGEYNPYANDGQRKTVEDIEPTADHVKILEEEKKYIADRPWDQMLHIEKVDWLREEIVKAISVNEHLFLGVSFTRLIAIARTNTYNHLSEARFWLGFELQRIRENND
jgi:hypothetical protein